MSGPSEASTTAWLGLGGNIGDPAAAMGAALGGIDADPRIELQAVSSLYRTPPWGLTDQPDFLNAVARIRTDLSARDLLDLCLSIETSLKRVRAARWGPRLIDIDILVFGDAVIDEDGLHVPHPRMLDRAFVMLPLAEIGPDLVLGGRLATDWAGRLDTTGIDRLPGGDTWWRSA